MEEMRWPEGTFGLLLARPPWPFEEGAVSPARLHPPMTVDAIAALAPRVQAITAPHAVLYMVATAATVVSGDAVRVLQAWGFNGRSTHVWVREHMGSGAWVRPRHEHVLIATRGNPVPPGEMLRPDSVLTDARGLHGENPTELYEVLERCYEGVPRVELFGGEAREGWVTWGSAADVGAQAQRGIRVRHEASQPREEVPSGA
jgi:N6-adenosine-specific RNA methylase IME4